MQDTIFERYEFNEIEVCCEKYLPLVSAIEKNSCMQRLGLYESELSEGLFIHCRLELSIPTNGVYEGLDVCSDEEILIYVRTDYPFSAPAVLFVRNNFPTSRIPHLNLGVADSKIHLLNPCLYRGDINEWFYQYGPETFCDRVNEWFSDLINGELMENDGFETIRYENTSSYAEIDFDYLYKLILNYKRDCGVYVLQMINKTERYFKILNQEYSKGLSQDILPCIFVFDRKNVMNDYISVALDTERDLKIFPCEEKIYRGICKIRERYYEKEKTDLFQKVLIVLAVKRPTQVIGGFSDFEFIAVQMSYDFNNSRSLEDCRVQKVIPIQSLSNEMAERLSGTELIPKKPIVMLGCGALGSKVSMNLARMGYIEQHFYDRDVILPHNLVRHHECGNYVIGSPKSELMKAEIKQMFPDSKSTSHVGNIFHVDEFQNGLIVDCTASKRCLFWSASTDNVKTQMIRSEIYLGGKIGITLFEGMNRNPDLNDMQVSLYQKALDEPLLAHWLNYNQPEDMRYHIGFGCSSDTTILDDASICNHASIVPHLINKYQERESGVVCVNFFDKNNLENNRVYIYEMEPMLFLKTTDGWDIHIRSSLYNTIYKYSEEKFENAGLWIGSIQEQIKRITVVDTFIPEDNIRNTNTVTMGQVGVKEYLNSLNSKTNSMLKYIGEWHTHTFGDALPSQQDRAVFDKIKSKTEAFLMTIISPAKTRNYFIKGKKGWE